MEQLNNKHYENYTATKTLESLEFLVAQFSWYFCSIRGYLSTTNLISRQKHILEELSLLLKLKTDTCMKLHSHEKMKKAHNPRKRAATN